jgi:benzoyl-CoA reductase/2-hydroxyglutaryl-CoA dehydratase subunit BcrC/BadD/HgdB
MGLALSGQFPPPQAIVASNSPCDAGMSSYTVFERLADVPAFRLDLPYRFRDERAVDYYVGELRRMIDFLERHTPGRMDLDRLRAVCEERNRAIGHMLDLFDMLRARPAPVGSDVVFLGNLVFANLIAGHPAATEALAGIAARARASLAGGGALAAEKVRVLLWNPATLVFPELFSWAEEEFGAIMVMDMLTYQRHPLIDTTSEGSMLRGLARNLMQGPMARHTLGPVEYFFEDLFFIHEHFSADTIWMAAHVGCKNTQALLGMMRERCRERRIPLLIIDYDLADSRVVSADGVKEQVIRFMETVMVT